LIWPKELIADRLGPADGRGVRGAQKNKLVILIRIELKFYLFL
jgi:hypothetical protein